MYVVCMQKPHPFIQVQHKQVTTVVYPSFLHVSASIEHGSILIKLDKCMSTARVWTGGILSQSSIPSC